MSLDTLALRTKPQYWIAAVYKIVPGKGLIFQGYTPYMNATWDKWLDRLMGYSRNPAVRTRSYYWDPGTSGAGAWKLDPGGDEVAHGKISGEVIGTLERRNPLPPGRYWQDIFNKQAHDWNDWLAARLKEGSVSIEKAEHFNRDPLRDGSWLPVALQPENMGTISDRMWVLFKVLKPVEWPAVKLGFPTIADATVNTSADTAQNPPGPSPGEEIATTFKDYVVTPVVGLGVLYLGAKLLFGMRR